MTALRDADGAIIGEGGCGRWVCSRSAADRRGFGCQTRAMDALPSNAVAMCPKTQEYRDRIRCGDKVTWDGKVGDKTMSLSANEQRIANDSLRRYGVKLGRDGVAVPLEGYKPGVGIVKDDDGDLTARILNACRGAGDDFTDEDIAEVEALLAKAGLEAPMATDGRPRMALDARGERERRRLHQCLDNRIANGGFDAVYKHPLPYAPASAKEEEDFKARMFPNYARLR